MGRTKPTFKEMWQAIDERFDYLMPPGQLRFRLERGATLPTRATDGSAGYDLAAIKDYDLTDGKRAFVGTGVHVAIPQGYVGLVFERSSLHRRGISLMNKVAVIDSDFRGEIRLPLIWSPLQMGPYGETDDTGGAPGVIAAGERVAQLVVVPCLVAEPIAVAELGDTERGESGFGSTGR